MSAAPRRLPVFDAEGPTRPVTRGDCVDGERPCPWVSCTHHAIHGVLLGERGAQIDDDAVAELIATMPASCTLDVADEGGATGGKGDGAGTLETIGDLWGVTRERVRQIEAKALKHMRWPARDLRSDLSEDELPEASAPKPVPIAAATIDWMGDGEAAPENDSAPAAMGAAEETTMATKGSTAKAAGWTAVPCRFPGCTKASAEHRDALDPALRPFCTQHRTRAQGIRTVRKLGAAEAVAVLLAGAGKQHATKAETSPRAPDTTAALLDEQRAQIADLGRLLAQAQERAEALRVDRDALLRRQATRADVASPWARLQQLATATRPGQRVWWAVDEEDGVWMASGLDCGDDGTGEPFWRGDGETPDEALSALVGVLEGDARAKVAALTAALEGGR